METKRPCNKLLPVESTATPEGHQIPVLGADCPAGVPAGTPLVQLDVLCEGCQHRVEGVEVNMPTAAAMPVPENTQASAEVAAPTLSPNYQGPVRASAAPDVQGTVIGFQQHDTYGSIWQVQWPGPTQPSWHQASDLIAGAVQPPTQTQPQEPSQELPQAPAPEPEPVEQSQPQPQMPKMPEMPQMPQASQMPEAPPAQDATPQVTTPAPAAPPSFSTLPRGQQRAEPPTIPMPDNAFGEEQDVLEDLEPVLMQHIPELKGGPSVGGYSSHTLEAAQGGCWFKCYLKHVLGLRKNNTSDALAFGTLYHACKFMHYLSSGARTLEPCQVLRTHVGGPLIEDLVNRVGLLLHVENQKYGAEEAQRWSIRELEAQDIFWSDPVKISGRTYQLPFTCRYDLIFAMINPGDAHPAPNMPVPQGVVQGDYKTSSRGDWSVTEGYMLDPQFLHNTVMYLKGNLRDRHGPLAGVMVHVALKHKTPKPDKSFFRIYTTHDAEAAERYYLQEMLPAAVGLHGRLVNPDLRNNPDAWPQNHHYCPSHFGCPYRSICSKGGMRMVEQMVASGRFRIDESKILNVESFLSPPADVKRKAIEADPARRAAAERSSLRTKQRKEISEIVAQLIHAEAQANAWPTANPENYLKAGHTEASVKKSLASDLAESYREHKGTTFQLHNPTINPLTFDMEVKERGFSWFVQWDTGEKISKGKNAGKPKMEKRSGQATWKQLAEVFCRDWWSLNKLVQMGNEPLPNMADPANPGVNSDKGPKPAPSNG